MNEALSLSGALERVFRKPGETLLRHWNWKSALLSSLVRGGIFFGANFGSGLDAALGAMLAEFCLRTITSGFCGALTQAFRSVRPAWKGMVAVLVLLPVANHALEFTVHWIRGTPALLLSIGVSMAFTVLSTSFNYFAMRRGLLTVGHGSHGLLRDLAEMPRLIWLYCASIGGLVARAVAALWRFATWRFTASRSVQRTWRPPQRDCCDQSEL